MKRQDRKKGRAKGGIVIGVRKSWAEEKDVEIIKIEENLIKSRVNTKKGIYNIWTIYNTGRIEEVWKLWEDLDFMDEENLI